MKHFLQTVEAIISSIGCHSLCFNEAWDVRWMIIITEGNSHTSRMNFHRCFRMIPPTTHSPLKYTFWNSLRRHSFHTSPPTDSIHISLFFPPDSVKFNLRTLLTTYGVYWSSVDCWEKLHGSVPTKIRIILQDTDSCFVTNDLIKKKCNKLFTKHYWTTYHKVDLLIWLFHKFTTHEYIHSIHCSLVLCYTLFTTNFISLLNPSTSHTGFLPMCLWWGVRCVMNDNEDRNK